MTNVKISHYVQAQEEGERLLSDESSTREVDEKTKQKEQNKRGGLKKKQERWI